MRVCLARLLAEAAELQMGLRITLGTYPLEYGMGRPPCHASLSR